MAVGGQQCFDPLAQHGVRAAGVREKLWPSFRRVVFHGVNEDLLRVG